MPRKPGRPRPGLGDFTYSEVGATRGELPTGYRSVSRVRRLGSGAEWFTTAADRLLTWGMHRRAGVRVDAGPRVEPDAVAVLRLRLGPLRISAPVRVVYLIEEPTVRGFAYGTLPGHPESGEEQFLVRLGADGMVTGEIRAFSRPGSWLTRLGGPVARAVQDVVTERYLTALTSSDHRPAARPGVP